MSSRRKAGTSSEYIPDKLKMYALKFDLIEARDKNKAMARELIEQRKKITELEKAKEELELNVIKGLIQDDEEDSKMQMRRELKVLEIQLKDVNGLLIAENVKNDRLTKQLKQLLAREKKMMARIADLKAQLDKCLDKREEILDGSGVGSLRVKELIEENKFLKDDIHSKELELESLKLSYDVEKVQKEDLINLLKSIVEELFLELKYREKYYVAEIDAIQEEKLNEFKNNIDPVEINCIQKELKKIKENRETKESFTKYDVEKCKLLEDESALLLDSSSSSSSSPSNTDKDLSNKLLEKVSDVRKEALARNDNLLTKLKERDATIGILKNKLRDSKSFGGVNNFEEPLVETEKDKEETLKLIEFIGRVKQELDIFEEEELNEITSYDKVEIIRCISLLKDKLKNSEEKLVETQDFLSKLLNERNEQSGDLLRRLLNCSESVSLYKHRNGTILKIVQKCKDNFILLQQRMTTADALLMESIVRELKEVETNLMIPEHDDGGSGDAANNLKSKLDDMEKHVRVFTTHHNEQLDKSFVETGNLVQAVKSLQNEVDSLYRESVLTRPMVEPEATSHRTPVTDYERLIHLSSPTSPALSDRARSSSRFTSSNPSNYSKGRKAQSTPLELSSNKEERKVPTVVVYDPMLSTASNENPPMAAEQELGPTQLPQKTDASTSPFRNLTVKPHTPGKTSPRQTAGVPERDTPTRDRTDRLQLPTGALNVGRIMNSVDDLSSDLSRLREKLDNTKKNISSTLEVSQDIERRARKMMDEKKD